MKVVAGDFSSNRACLRCVAQYLQCFISDAFNTKHGLMHCIEEYSKGSSAVHRKQELKVRICEEDLSGLRMRVKPFSCSSEDRLSLLWSISFKGVFLLAPSEIGEPEAHIETVLAKERLVEVS